MSSIRVENSIEEEELLREISSGLTQRLDGLRDLFSEIGQEAKLI